MPNSPHWSTTSAPCRLEWHASRLLAGLLLMLGMLSGFSVLASEMPRSTAVPLALAALAHATWLARRQWRLPPRKLVLRGRRIHARWRGHGPVSVSACPCVSALA